MDKATRIRSLIEQYREVSSAESRRFEPGDSQIGQVLSRLKQQNFKIEEVDTTAPYVFILLTNMGTEQAVVIEYQEGQEENAKIGQSSLYASEQPPMVAISDYLKDEKGPVSPSVH